MTLKEIAIELLEKYEASENVAICEYSTNINKDMDLLDKEVKKYRRMIEDADRKTETQSDYERGKSDAWKIAQMVFDSTVTLYEAEDVAKQIAKTEPQTDCSWK